MTTAILISWMGNSDVARTDRDGKPRDPADDPGPVLRVLRARPEFERVYLLHDYIKPRRGQFTPDEFINRWLLPNSAYRPGQIVPKAANEKLFNRLEEIWRFTEVMLQAIQDETRQEYSSRRFAILVSAGYPIGTASMIVASETIFDPRSVELLNSYRPERGDCGEGAGVERVHLPFSLNLREQYPRMKRLLLEELLQHTEVHPGFDAIVGKTECIRRARAEASRVAGSNLPVLLLGESGTGKELFARAIHQAGSRAGGPFVAVNCAAIPEALFESELFGHVRGAFNNADRDRPGRVSAADGGTLFLDELGELPLEQQAKLLRFLNDGSYYPVGGDEEQFASVRLVTATNRDLDAAIRSGEFREDLHARINRSEIRLPPLRDRRSDIPLIATRLLPGIAEEVGNHDLRLTEDSLALLESHPCPWTANVRELQRCLTGAALLCSRDEISPDHLMEVLKRATSAPPGRLAVLSSTELLNQLAATFDEIFTRFERGEELVPGSAVNENGLEELILTLLYGRAAEHCGGQLKNRDGAMVLLKNYRELRTIDEVRRLLDYGIARGRLNEEANKALKGKLAKDPVAEPDCPLQDWLNERLIRQIRGSS